MRTPVIAIVVALMLRGWSSAFGQDQSGQDVFDPSAFDQTVQKGTQQEQAAKLEILFGGELLSDNSAYTTADFEGFAAGGSFSGKAFTKVSIPSYGVLFLSYNFTHNLYQGAGGTVPGGSSSSLSQPLGDLLSNSYALSEFYAGFDIARVVFLRLGNQLIAWGPSAIWTPVDFINLQRANPLSPLDLRVGKPGLRVHVPLGISNVFLFGDFSGTVTGAPPALVVNDPLETTNLAARWDLTAFGFELALSGYWGASIQDKYGFDFSGRVLGFDVYGELAVGFPQGSDPLTWATSVGFQRTLGELGYWAVQGEFFYNDAGTADWETYPDLLLSGSFTPFYLGKYYAYAGLTRSHLFIDGVSATLAGFANFSDGSYLARLSTAFDLPGLVPFSFAFSYAGGGPDKEFTWFVGDRSLSLDIRIRFSF
jgi:hypothetical protein